MEKMEIAKAGHTFMQVVDRVRDMKRRGYTVEDCKQVLDKYEPSTVELASKFLHEIKIARLGKCAVLFAVAASLQACGLMGVREFEVWEGGPKWAFSEGLDFHVGANAIDNVKDQRGVLPRSAGSTPAKAEKY